MSEINTALERGINYTQDIINSGEDSESDISILCAINATLRAMMLPEKPKKSWQELQAEGMTNIYKPTQRVHQEHCPMKYSQTASCACQPEKPVQVPEGLEGHTCYLGAGSEKCPECNPEKTPEKPDYTANPAQNKRESEYPLTLSFENCPNKNRLGTCPTWDISSGCHCDPTPSPTVTIDREALEQWKQYIESTFIEQHLSLANLNLLQEARRALAEKGGEG